MQAVQLPILGTIRLAPESATRDARFFVIEGEDGRALGSASIRLMSQHPRRVWLQYAVDSEYLHGEAVRLLLQHAFQHLEAVIVQTECPATDIVRANGLERMGFSPALTDSTDTLYTVRSGEYLLSVLRLLAA